MSAPPRPPYVAGNWKMNKDLAGAIGAAEAVARQLPREVADGALDAGLFPPALFLRDVAAATRGTRVVVGAQDMHWERAGAFTGEISGPMIASAGGTSVIIGHSERRRFFGETDDRVRRKLGAAIATGLRAILCVGETLEERDAERTLGVVSGQLGAACEGLSPADAAGFDVAYEPVWAIGTGRNATPEQATEVHDLIRRTLVERFGRDGEKTRILYGGSVTPGNIDDLMQSPAIDGALVGGASLEAGSFLELLARAIEAKRKAVRR